ncbi:hypothetical protein BDV18DRAFT_36777 [Aspergillus unguis]
MSLHTPALKCKPLCRGFAPALCFRLLICITFETCVDRNLAVISPMKIPTVPFLWIEISLNQPDARKKERSAYSVGSVSERLASRRVRSQEV